jgi:hypothetical protein
MDVDSVLGQSLEPTHTPRPTGPTASWPKTRASSREPVRSGAVTVPPEVPEPASRRTWPFLAAMAVVGVSLGGAGVLWVSKRTPAAPPPQTASLGPLEPVKRIEPPPAPPVTPVPPGVLSSTPEPSTAREAIPEGKHPQGTGAVREKPPGHKRRARVEAAKATEPQPTLAATEPAKAVEPEPPAAASDAIKPEARKLLDQAEDALGKNKPLDAARLVDQSFYVQKTPLGYAIQARAACHRHDVGGARAAFRNIGDPQLKQVVLRACVRQGVWLF